MHDYLTLKSKMFKIIGSFSIFTVTSKTFLILAIIKSYNSFHVPIYKKHKLLELHQ